MEGLLSAPTAVTKFSPAAVVKVASPSTYENLGLSILPSLLLATALGSWILSEVSL